MRVAVMAATLGAAACDEEGDARAAQARYERGLELLTAGNVEEARSEFTAALQFDPSHVPSHLELARLADARGDWQGAVNRFGEIVMLDPDQVEARVRLAHLMALGKDFTAAEGYAQKAFELAPDDPEVIAAMALVDQAQGESRMASAWADRALAADPANWTARVVKARIAADAGDVEVALELIDELLAERPAEMEINLMKSRLLDTPGREAELREHLARMAERFPDPWIKEWLAYLRDKAGDAAGASEMLEALADQDPSDVQAAFDLIRSVQRERGVEAARHEFAARIAAASPDAALQLRLHLAEFEDAAGRPDESATVLSALIGDAPDSVAADTARIRIARKRLASGEPDEARRLVDDVLTRDPRHPEALALSGSMLLDAGDADEAIRVLREGVEAAPDDVELSLTLARAYDVEGRTELARDRFEAATQSSGFDPGVVAAYAEFLADKGQPEAVVFLLEAAAHRHPEDADIQARLEAARERNKIP